MRYGTSLVVALAAIGSVEFFAAGTPLTSMQIAHAQALPSVWQNKAKKLATQINKSRQSLAANAADIFSTQFKADQFGKRIANYTQALAKFPAADDANLNQAKEQLAALQSEFAAAQGGGSTAAAPAPAAEPSAPATPSQSSGSTATAATPAPAADVPQLVSGQRVRVKKLTRDMTNVREGITTEGPSELQDPEIVAKYKKRLGQFTEAVKRYPQAQDPDVIAAREAYLALRKTLQGEFARAKEQLEILGDVPARFALIENREKEYPVPAPLEPPFTAADVKAWLEASGKAKTAAQFDWDQLKEIEPIAHLPAQSVSGRMNKYSYNDIGRLVGIINDRATRVQKGYPAILSNIDTAIEIAMNKAGDPTARKTAEQVKFDLDALGEALIAAESGVTLNAGVGKDNAKAEARVAEIQAEIDAYPVTRNALIDAVRMPESASDDAERLAIAKDIVERPKYEFGEHGRIVLNTAEILEKERKESEIEIDDVDVYGGEIRMSGTKETTIWKWKEFQFATPLKEPDSDLWRIYYIKPKFFTSGASTTPLNSWISGSVVEGELIREENIGK